MKLLKALSVIVIIATLIGLGVVLSYRLNDWVFNSQYTRGWKDGYIYIKTWKELQAQVGAERDGKWGPNSTAKYDEAIIDQYVLWGFNPDIREFDKAMLARAEK